MRHLTGVDMKRVLLAVALLTTAACGGGSTSTATPPATPPGSTDVSALTKIVLPVGDAHCPAGGVAISVNGGTVEYVCNGTPGVAGATGPTGPTGPAGPPGASDVPTSGSRIIVRQQVMVGADGTRAAPTFGFFDTSLNVACTLRLAADGVTRCLPSSTQSNAGISYFLDSACTQKIAYHTSSTCLWEYYSESTSVSATSTCGTNVSLGATQISSRGALVAPSSVTNGTTVTYTVFVRAGDTCQTASFASGVGGVAWYAVAVVSPANFVAFTAEGS